MQIVMSWVSDRNKKNTFSEISHIIVIIIIFLNFIQVGLAVLPQMFTIYQ